MEEFYVQKEWVGVDSFVMFSYCWSVGLEKYDLL